MGGQGDSTCHTSGKLYVKITVKNQVEKERQEFFPPFFHINLAFLIPQILIEIKVIGVILLYSLDCRARMNV